MEKTVGLRKRNRKFCKWMLAVQKKNCYSYGFFIIQKWWTKTVMAWKKYMLHAYLIATWKQASVMNVLFYFSDPTSDLCICKPLFNLRLLLAGLSNLKIGQQEVVGEQTTLLEYNNRWALCLSRAIGNFRESRQLYWLLRRDAAGCHDNSIHTAIF